MTTENGLALTRTTEPGRLTLAEAIQLGEVVYKSNSFPDVRNAAAAVMKILAGAEMGFGPLASLADVYFIDGKPSVGAHLRAAAIKRSAKYDYDVIERSDAACELEFFERKQDAGGPTRKHMSGWVSVGKLRYTIEEAVRKGWTTTGGGKAKSPWVKTPANMLFARVLTDGYKTYCPDLSAGVLSYDPDELDSEPRAEPLLPAPVAARVAAAPPQPNSAAGDIADADYTVNDVTTADAPPVPTAPIGETPPEKRLTGDQSDRIDALLIELAVDGTAFARWIKREYGHESPHLMTVAQASEVIRKQEASLIGRLAKQLDFTAALPARLQQLYGQADPAELTTEQRAEVVEKLRAAIAEKAAPKEEPAQPGAKS